jgi:nucleoside-diphosphate-sugar epimerase
MPRSIAITGATGFIGGRIAVRLLGAGYAVKALRRSSSPPKTSPEPSIHWVHGALEDAESLQRLVEDVNTVIHCAGVVRGTTQQSFDTVNAAGVRRLARICAKQSPAPRFLLLSSLAAREPSISPYAASKRKGEQVVADLSEMIRWAALRAPAVYGPGDRALLPLFQLMSRGIAPILGPKEARFSLLHVDDLAAAVLHWLAADCSQRIYELDDGRTGGYSWEDTVNTAEALRGKRVVRIPVSAFAMRRVAAGNVSLARLFGYAPMLTPGKVRELRHCDWVCDNRELSRAIGWKPQVSLEAGLRNMLDWNDE